MINYYSKSPVVKQTEGLSADHLIKAAKSYLKSLKLPTKLISEDGTNSASKNSKNPAERLRSNMLCHCQTTTKAMDKRMHA